MEDIKKSIQNEDQAIKEIEGKVKLASELLEISENLKRNEQNLQNDLTTKKKSIETAE